MQDMINAVSVSVRTTSSRKYDRNVSSSASCFKLNEGEGKIVCGVDCAPLPVCITGS
jgi:hypothetical protein